MKVTVCLVLEESTEWFREIKANLGLAVAVRELRPGTLRVFYLSTPNVLVSVVDPEIF